jgi:hypothetical protein
MTRPRDEDSPVSSIGAPPSATDQNGDLDATRAVTGPIEDLLRQIGIDKVYGTPITKGDTTVVPVAELRTGFGFGSGHDAAADGRGGGAGAGLRMIPRGYLHITPDGVEYRPIYGLKSFVIGGAFIGWLLYRLLSR